MPTLARPVPAAPRRIAPHRLRLVEISLVRKSLRELVARRHRCAHCERTPLIGERVYVYGSAAGERMVCELCRHLRREPPERSELVRSAESERCVRVRRSPAS